jgi:hypothetical protein
MKLALLKKPYPQNRQGKIDQSKLYVQNSTRKESLEDDPLEEESPKELPLEEE